MDVYRSKHNFVICCVWVITWGYDTNSENFHTHCNLTTVLTEAATTTNQMPFVSDRQPLIEQAVLADKWCRKHQN